MHRVSVALVSLLVITLGTHAGVAQESEAAKVDSALSAGPAFVTDGAKVQDWDGTVLREGSNGWTCLPDIPETPGNDPMCLDDVWMGWVDAWMNETEPTVERIAFGYMLQGGNPESNVDPYAEGPTDDNEWLDDPVPHVMMLVPDESWLEGLPTHPREQGPWVMWRDTPYVHVMIPTPRK